MGLWSWGDSNEGSSRWWFVVDTDSYSGNFERELSSYVVGQYDEHGGHRGGPFARMYEQECPDDPFNDLVEWRLQDPGDDGYFRAPCDIAPTPGKKGKFNSVAIGLSAKPTKKQLNLLVERAMRFGTLSPQKKWDTIPKILGCRLVEEVTSLKSTAL